MSDCATYLIVTFPSTHAALSAEKKLKDEGVVGVEFIPVPREISSNCGVCLKINKQEKLSELLKEITCEALWLLTEKQTKESKRKIREYQKVIYE